MVDYYPRKNPLTASTTARLFVPDEHAAAEIVPSSSTIPWSIAALDFNCIAIRLDSSICLDGLGDEVRSHAEDTVARRSSTKDAMAAATRQYTNHPQLI